MCVRLEDRDEVSDSLLLVLGNAFRDPGDVADFLSDCKLIASTHGYSCGGLTCSLSFIHAYTTAGVN